MREPFYFHAVLFALAVSLAGCSDPKVVTYQIAKESEPALPPGGVEPPTLLNPPSLSPSATSSSDPVLVWSAPASWTPKPITAMRKGSYKIAGETGEEADLSITAFPGAVGGELANINRWRGQLALPEIQERDLESSISHTKAGELSFIIVDCVSAEASPRGILGAMTPFNGSMWFFKLTGSEKLLGSVKPAFLDFLKTIKPSPTNKP
jgi:hypothetical protein